MDIFDAINDACKVLPDEWIISLQMENGSAHVELYDPDGNEIELPDSADKDLAEQINEAIETAVSAIEWDTDHG